MRRFIIASVAVAGMLLAASNSSDAGGIHLRYGGHYGGHGHYGGSGYGGGHGHYGGSGYGLGYGHYGAYSPVYQTYPSYPLWHDTSHYDYHPGGFQRHRNHYHYVPGHYDFHQDGHWHY